MLCQVSPGQLQSDEARRVFIHPVDSGPNRPNYIRLKAAIEWLLALVLFVLTLPLLICLAVAVKLTSSGPAFYSQNRLGHKGRVFRIYKIRTMRHNCESATGPVWSLPGDKRVTRLGRWLRESHLDELPQLWNVIQGRMGLVGPRPERPEIAARIEKSIPAFRQRLLVRPGVTGLAQMRLPADTGLEGVRKKLAHDLYYVREVSFILDVRVAICTALYFMGAAVHAMCKLLVNSYGHAAERTVTVSKIDDDRLDVGAA